MPRAPQTRDAFTVGQLAQRWGVSAARIQQLATAGKLPGAFCIPSAGRYGEAVRIPKETVLAVEAAWQLTPLPEAIRRRPVRLSGEPALRHFPELAATPDAECPVGDRC